MQILLGLPRTHLQALSESNALFGQSSKLTQGYPVGLKASLEVNKEDQKIWQA